MNPTLARATYGALFTILLPGLLIAWAVRLDSLLVLPLPPVLWIGPWVLGAGIGLMLAGTMSLWRYGRGLPMSAFPPERLVTQGAYQLVANPLYVGAVGVALGFSLLAESPAGVWIVTPMLATLAAAWVCGFEASHTRALYGEVHRPAMRLPDAHEGAPAVAERIAVFVRVLAVWFVAYMSVEWLGMPRDGIAVPRLPGELDWPVVPWTESLYLITYAMVLAAPLVAGRARELRQFAVDALVATALIVPFYLLVPFVVEAKPVPAESAWSALLRWERIGDLPVTALPAFHLVWTLIAANVYAMRWPRSRWLWWFVSAAVAVSCVTTGMHAVLDVIAGAAAYVIVRHAYRIWQWLCRQTERIANSWHEVRIGRIRLLNHGAYAALGGVSGVFVATTLAGASEFAWITAATIIAIVGAGVWAQVVEGSSQLLRPYGYFGAVIGVLLTGVIAIAVGHDGWLLLASMGVGGCLTVAFGRLRCLVQGCCHGHALKASWSIHYTHPQSRVVRLSALDGVGVHPTPLYSALWSLVCCAMLVRLWVISLPLPFIAGATFMLAGLGRFVEEHYRGEPQTAQFAGLRLYQWLAMAMIVLGAAFTCVDGGVAPTPSLMPVSDVLWLTILLMFIYAAYGLDFPDSNARFSRLV